jgi:hypothetical protein
VNDGTTFSAASYTLSITVNALNDAPTLVSAGTLDLDANGQIDTLRLTFSRTVVDSTFPGYSANAVGSAQSDWLVAGSATNVFLVHGTAVTGGASDSANDAVLYLRFAESGTPDTDATVDVTTTATPGLQAPDTEVLVQVNSGTVTETDTAAPVLLSAVAALGGALTITFSEPVETSPGACAPTADLAPATDFVYSNVSSGDVTGLATTGSDLDACSDGIIVVDGDPTTFTANDIGVDQVRAAASQIFDMEGNAAGTSFVTLQ